VVQKREKERQEESEKKEDERLLREVMRILLEIERVYKSNKTPRPLIEMMDELSQLSAEIKRAENKTIRTEIWQFSARYRETQYSGPVAKEMRREVEEMKKIESIFRIVESKGGEQ
jgi:hypothetical protein